MNTKIREKERLMTTAKLLGASGLIAGMVLAGGIDQAQAQATDITVILPNPSAINVFPLHTAIGEGYFADEGLNVTVQAVDGSSQVLQAMAAGQAQIGLPGPGPVLAARSRDEDVVFIYNNYPKSIFGLVVKEESPHQGPADLKGSTVGVGTADGAEVSFARAILADAGLTEGEDYEFLAIGDGGMAATAFLRDDVASYAAAVSDAAILESRGIPLREITPEEYLSYFGNGYAALRSYIDENPDVIEAFGRGLVRGVEFSMDPANKDQVLEYAKQGNPQEGEDPAFASALYEAIKNRMTPLDSSHGWGYQPPEHWQIWHDSLVESGDLQPLPNLEDAYTNQFIETWNAVKQ
jgi:NitT/TauT family transport system substrate-binding protein